VPTQRLAAWLRFAPHLLGTRQADIPHDLLAGVTVAAIAIPQALAYAFVAGLPPEMGLLAAAVPAAVAALWGSSRYLVSGPTNPTALLIGASVVAPAVAAGHGVPIVDVLLTALFAGVLLLGFALLGVGRASRFLSDSVVVGFATGTGVHIARFRVTNQSGVSPEPLRAGWAPAVWPQLEAAGRAVLHASPEALLLFAGVPVAVLALRRLSPLVPGALLSLAVATALAFALGWDTGPDSLLLVGRVTLDWQGVHLPATGDWAAMAGPALAIALLVTLQSIASARAIQPLSGPPLDVDRELVAQGLSNVVAGVTGSMPSSGSFSRTAVARSSGGRSRLTALVAALTVLVAVPFMAPLIGRVPMAALAGLVALSGVDLISWRGLRRAATTRGDLSVLIVTVLATLCIDLVHALYVGVFLSLALLVRRSGDLLMVELVRSDGGRFREIPLDDETGCTPAVMLHLEGDLNFAVASELKERLEEIARRRPKVVTIRLKRARHLDATVVEALREAVVSLQAAGIAVLLCGLSDHQTARLSNTELGHLLGEDGMLRTGDRLFEGFEHALTRTRELLPATPETEMFRTQSTDVWLYEI
jgi:SulP family sulfate permease